MTLWYNIFLNEKVKTAIDVQYRRLESNGKIDFHVVQIALFVKYRFTCLSMISDTVKCSRIDHIRLSLVKWCLVALAIGL